MSTRNPLLNPAKGDVVRTLAARELRVDGPREDFPGAWWVRVDGRPPIAILASVWRQWVRHGTVIERGGDE